MNELSVDAAEEIELLIKWLGPISSTYARSIKISNVNNPVIGLERLWERLDDRYGCPELIEETLKRKLDRFPKLSNKDYKKLYELTDILAEIQSIKEDDQYHDLLAYYDTSSGVIPIVRKLPHSLQEKWTSRAVRYKKERKVTFPPFCEFLAFIQEMSQIRNDPGFMYDVNNNQEKLSSTGTQNRLRVHVKKTEVTRNQVKGDTDSELKCIVHTNSKHALSECNAFRAKSIEERRQRLKENGVCFRCCGSKAHLKRDCKVDVKCSECGSQFHCSALHTLKRFVQSTQQHGGKDDNKRTVNIVNKCTDVCGSHIEGKSCAKILPINVTHIDYP